MSILKCDVAFPGVDNLCSTVVVAEIFLSLFCCFCQISQAGDVALVSSNLFQQTHRWIPTGLL